MTTQKKKAHDITTTKRLLRLELPTQIKKELKELVGTSKGYDLRYLQAAISDELIARVRLHQPSNSKTIEESEEKAIKLIHDAAKKFKAERNKLKPKIEKALDEMLPHSGYSPEGQEYIRKVVNEQLELGAELAFSSQSKPSFN